MRPNRSLERMHTGLALRSRATVVHHPSREPTAISVLAVQALMSFNAFHTQPLLTAQLQTQASHAGSVDFQRT